VSVLYAFPAVLCAVEACRAVLYCCLLRAGWCCCGSIQTLDRFLHLVPALGIVNYLVDDVLVGDRPRLRAMSIVQGCKA
jgi:hypothetical protein